MSQVFRPMRRDADGLPQVANTATGLGVRVPKGIDVENNMVKLNDKGMSVRPTVADVTLEQYRQDITARAK